MSSFEVKFATGETYKKYLELEPSFSSEFRRLTWELMVETYIRDQMGRKTLSDTEFSVLRGAWRMSCDIRVGKYPYDMTVFPHAHPWTRAAAIEGKKRLGIVL